MVNVQTKPKSQPLKMDEWLNTVGGTPGAYGPLGGQSMVELSQKLIDE
jgi:hypothetical protein